MKPTQFNSQKSDAALAIELKAVIDQRRVIEEREEELKRYFKTNHAQTSIRKLSPLRWALTS
jgi:hypothetical protein